MLHEHMTQAVMLHEYMTHATSVGHNVGTPPPGRTLQLHLRSSLEGSCADVEAALDASCCTKCLNTWLWSCTWNGELEQRVEGRQAVMYMGSCAQQGLMRTACAHTNSSGSRTQQARMRTAGAHVHSRG